MPKSQPKKDAAKKPKAAPAKAVKSAPKAPAKASKAEEKAPVEPAKTNGRPVAGPKKEVKLTPFLKMQRERLQLLRDTMLDSMSGGPKGTLRSRPE